MSAQLASDIWMFDGNGKLLAAFNENQVRFIVVGGAAVRFYAPSRTPDDLDLLIHKTADNVERINRALLRWPGMVVPPDKVLHPQKTQICLKSWAHYADIVTAEDGFDFDTEWVAGVDGRINGEPVRFASKALVIQMKSADSARPKDVADVELLSGGD